MKNKYSELSKIRIRSSSNRSRSIETRNHKIKYSESEVEVSEVLEVENSNIEAAEVSESEVEPESSEVSVSELVPEVLRKFSKKCKHSELRIRSSSNRSRSIEIRSHKMKYSVSEVVVSEAENLEIEVAKVSVSEVELVSSEVLVLERVPEVLSKMNRSKEYRSQSSKVSTMETEVRSKHSRSFKVCTPQRKILTEVGSQQISSEVSTHGPRTQKYPRFWKHNYPRSTHGPRIPTVLWNRYPWSSDSTVQSTFLVYLTCDKLLVHNMIWYDDTVHNLTLKPTEPVLTLWFEKSGFLIRVRIKINKQTNISKPDQFKMSKMSHTQNKNMCASLPDIVDWI